MTTAAASMSMAGDYPIGLEVDPPAPQNRLSVLLRLLYVIPHVIVLAFVGIAVGVVTLIAWIAILVTASYPEGMLRFSIGTLRWSARVNGYLWLLTDRYPPFSLEDDANYPIRLIAEGQVAGRNRLTVLFRIIMVIPQAIVVGVLNYAGEVVAVIAWFAALFTGSVPPGLHNFIAGWQRWSIRVSSYMLLHVDRYPPFSLS